MDWLFKGGVKVCIPSFFSEFLDVLDIGETSSSKLWVNKVNGEKHLLFDDLFLD